jgi:hypothetical protein
MNLPQISGFNQLSNYSYNPDQVNFTYTGDVESNVTWFISGENYDKSTHVQFTPESEKVNETSRRFQLKVDMSKFKDGAQPVDVKGKIGFESENVTLPYPDREVMTRIFKRGEYFMSSFQLIIISSYDTMIFEFEISL